MISEMHAPYVAALPGSYQSMNEIAAILKHPKLHEQLGPYPITEILAMENGYAIHTLDREIHIDVKHIQANAWCGASEFELIVHDPIMKPRPPAQDFELGEVLAESRG